MAPEAAGRIVSISVRDAAYQRGLEEADPNLQLVSGMRRARVVRCSSENFCMHRFL